VAGAAPASTHAVRTSTLEIAYEASGPASGVPIILLHGFPDDVHAYDLVAPPLAAAGHRVLVPYLRGYGPTRFLDPKAPRMAQQAAIGQDLVEFMDALGIERAALAGYDWGGRAACLAAILAPQRVRALVTIGGYNVQDTLAPPKPATAEQERAYWYQWYFNTERGRRGLAENRREICKLLWRDWSPSYRFDDATYELTAKAFDNPDFVEVVIHSYRHPPRQRARRSALRRDRAAPGRAPADHGADDHPARRRRRREPAAPHRRRAQALPARHPEPRRPRRRPLPAARETRRASSSGRAADFAAPMTSMPRGMQASRRGLPVSCGGFERGLCPRDPDLGGGSEERRPGSPRGRSPFARRIAVASLRA
jgi:pimeloyl-ACP methyl ester carboxylesterase